MQVCPLQSVSDVQPLVYDGQKEQQMLFLFTEHTIKYSVMLGVLLLTQHFFYPKGHMTCCCGDSML